MNARKLSALLLCACTVAVMLALPASAHAAYTANTECLACHDQATGSGAVSEVDFASGGLVDYTKCNACHWVDRATRTHSTFNHEHVKGTVSRTGYRYGGTNCPTCHGGFVVDNGDLSRLMTTSTPDGWFATATSSRSSSASELHAIHVNGSWPKANGLAASCASCHEAASCTACHSAPPAGHADHTKDALTGVYAYPPVTYKVGAGTPPSTPDVVTVIDETVTCVNAACHARSAAGTAAFTPFCGDCHAEKTSEHGYGNADHVADNGATLEPDSTIACGACHATDLMTEHAKPTSVGPRSCTTCHPSPRNTFTGWDQGCDQCHGLLAPDPKHGGEGAKHAGAVSADCTSCHPGSLQALHADATTAIGAVTYTACLVCHNDATSLPGKTCVSCHFTFAGHYSTTIHTSTWTLSATCSGAGCHIAGDRDLMRVHKNFRTTFSCAECHSSTRPEVIAAIAANQTACSACHAGASETEGHRAAHLASPPLVSGSSPPVPAYSYFTGSAGLTPTADCIGCHTSNLIDEHLGARDGATWAHAPQTDSTGAVLTCASCHASTDTRVSTAIALGNSSCESCHSVHGPIPQTHTSTFAATQVVPCADCHSSDLTSIHNYGKIATMPSGAELTGCAFCHGYFEVPRGTMIQAAIDGNQTACAACHAGAHTDSGGHLAPADANCSGCHVVGDIRTLHASRPCAVCHDNSAVGPITGKTAACASCHAPIETAATSHTGYASAHVSTRTECAGSGCHAIGNLAALHSIATTTVAGVPLSGCGVCHRSPTDQPVSADCMTCHAGHGDMTAKHTAPAGASCAQCHATAVLPIHATDPLGACKVCHDNALRVGDIRTKTAACVSCHATAVTAHTAYTSAHVAAQSGCVGSGCHATGDLTVLHSGAETTVAGVTYNACAVCHQSPTKQPVSAACTTCHIGHGDLTVAHAATVASAACKVCHETNDVRTLHAGCASCHSNPLVPTLPSNVECASCHGTLIPVDPAHYVETSHTASAVTGDCYRCHKLSMKAEHSRNTVSPVVTCVSCHEGKVDAFTAPWNKTCAACHTTASTHSGQAAKHATTASAACGGTGCHAVGDVAALHANAETANGTLTGCYVCHANSDTLPASAECATCHVGHGDLTVAHTAISSSACTACHETGDVRTIHTAGCASCHSNPLVPNLPANVECASCHGTLIPVDPAHYKTTAHAASETGCASCHYLDLKPEHFKASVSPAVTCVSCHEGKVDAFTAPWNKTCAACHATSHTAMAAKHVSANTSCSGTGCHAIGDVSLLHANVTGGGCQVCHTGPATGKTDCASSGCHTGVGTNHHALHDASAAIDAGCKGCHFTYLDDEHAALGYSCATCHSSTNVAVQAAIAASVRDCSACHPAVNGRDRHAAQNTTQFSKGNSGGHRAYSTLPFMKTSFVVGSATYTWPTPAASAFLKTGWTTTSMVTCDKCHTFTTTAAGPHGPAVKVNMDPAYPTDWKTVYLNSNGASSSTFICAKCHQNFGSMNDVHGEEDHEGSSDGKCIGCHTKVPHSWRLPRLLAYKDDPAPYNSLYLTGIRLKSYTPSNWSESDCSQSGCDEHSSSMSNRWPSAVQTVGTLKGAVKTAAGVAIIGATVTTDKGQSATTDASGNYSFGAVATGTYNVTASASGYTAQTKAATLAADQTVSIDFALAVAPVSSNLALGKTFTASRTSSTTYAASKAGDANVATYWWSGSSSYGSYQWLRVDLGASTSISKVEVAWSGTRYATEFRVYTSTDGSNWTQVYSTTSGGSGTRTVTFTARSARHVRVECRRAYSSSNGYGVAELRVFQ